MFYHMEFYILINTMACISTNVLPYGILILITGTMACVSVDVLPYEILHFDC